MPQDVVEKIDVVKVWNAYMAFQGNTLKTALATDLPEETVEEIANRDNWPAKIAQFNKLSTSGKDARSLAQQINRAANFMQGHKLRAILDKVIDQISNDPEVLKEFTQVYQPGGGIGRTTKNLTDLARAVEITHAVTMRALGDTPQEQPGGTFREDKEHPLTSLGAQVIKTLEGLNTTGAGVDDIEVVKGAIADVKEGPRDTGKHGS
jgi:hypothetical protein